MTGWSDQSVWLIIALLGLGTFAIRYSFLGLLGGRDLPDWLLRHLRYTAVSILPAIVTAQVLLPPGGTGAIDPARLAGAALAVAAGIMTKNAIVTIVVGMTAFLGIGALLG